MSSTGKIYVDYMGAAARIAATYRNASFYVDVINRRDEVAYRWEVGKAAWGDDDIEDITQRNEPYQFSRPDDPFWVPENRILLLADAIPYAFDIVTGNEDQHTFDSLLIRMEITGDEIRDLIREARSITKAAAPSFDADKLVRNVEDWMQNSQCLFLYYRAEYVALSINTGKFIQNCRIGRLEMKLA